MIFNYINKWLVLTKYLIIDFNKRFAIILILSISFSMVAQDESRILRGKVKSINNDISDILIINKNSKNSTISDSLGQFSIDIKLMDTILVKSIQYKTKDIIISKTIFNSSYIEINLIEDIINLNEVIVTPYNLTGDLNFDLENLDVNDGVNTATLGLPHADVIKLSQSERLLLEANRGKYIYLNLGVTINTHKIMNRISGRTKALEAMVNRDEIRKLESKILQKFSKKIISEGFNLSETEIDGFITFCMEQPDFLEINEKASSDEIWNYLIKKGSEFKSLVIQDKN